MQEIRTSSGEKQEVQGLLGYSSIHENSIFADEKSRRIWASFNNRSTASTREVTPSVLRGNHNEFLSDKYKPEYFTDLVGNHKLNRDIAMWAADWRRGTGTKPGLFAGPPGSGKSTSARVIARINGFRPFFFNASAERSGPELFKKISDITSSKKFLQKCSVCENNEKSEKNGSNESKKIHVCLAQEPLVILDEVDGVSLSEKNNAITFLLEKLFDSEGKFALRKPILFICNNMFARGMQGLRRACEVFRFRREEESVLRRAREILTREKISFIDSNLVDLARTLDFDIRAILNSFDLARFASGEQEVSLSSRLRSENDRTRDYFDLLGQVFFGQERVPEEWGLDFLDGTFLNFWGLERVQSDLPLADMILDSLTADIRSGGKRPLSCLPLIAHQARQRKTFRLEFISQTFQQNKMRSETKAKISDALQFSNFSQSQKIKYLNPIARMLCPRVDPGKITEETEQNVRDISFLMSDMNLVLRTNSPDDWSAPQESENREEFLEDFPSRSLKKPPSAASFKYEPDLPSFISFPKIPALNLSEAAGSLIIARYEYYGTFRKAGENNPKPPEHLPSSVSNKKLPFSSSIKYFYHDSVSNSVMYNVTADFLNF